MPTTGTRLTLIAPGGLPPWSDLADAPERVIFLDGEARIEVIGMAERAAFRIDLPDGRAVVWEMRIAQLAHVLAELTRRE